MRLGIPAVVTVEAPQPAEVKTEQRGVKRKHGGSPVDSFKGKMQKSVSIVQELVERLKYLSNRQSVGEQVSPVPSSKFEDIEKSLRDLHSAIETVETLRSAGDCINKYVGIVSFIQDEIDYGRVRKLFYAELETYILTEGVSGSAQAYRDYFSTLNGLLKAMLPTEAQSSEKMDDFILYCISRSKSGLDDFFDEKVIHAFERRLARDVAPYILENLYDRFINQRLLQLGSTSYLESADTRPCRRLIIASKDTFQGLVTIVEYLSAESKTLDDIIDGTIRAEDVVVEVIAGLFAGDKAKAMSCFEIAWGILQTLHKHGEADAARVVVSIANAQAIIPSMAQDSTLMVDGHGGQSEVNVSAYSKMKVSQFGPLLQDVLAADKCKAISHFILQCCNGGKVRNSSVRAYVKTAVNPEKSRIVFFRKPGQLPQDIFDQPYGRITLAEGAYAAMCILGRQYDMAFTFSENPISPSARCVDGNVGAHSYGDDSSASASTAWYQKPSPTLPRQVVGRAGRGLVKTVTLLPAPQPVGGMPIPIVSHRKASHARKLSEYSLRFNIFKPRASDDLTHSVGSPSDQQMVPFVKAGGVG